MPRHLHPLLDPEDYPDPLDPTLRPNRLPYCSDQTCGASDCQNCFPGQYLEELRNELKENQNIKTEL